MMVMVVARLVLISGGLTAKKRRGNRKDIAQYAVGYGFAFLIVGMFLTVIIDRLAS